MALLFRWLPVVLLGFVTACTEGEPRTLPQTIEVRVIDHAGVAVEGATLIAGSRAVATSSASGVATLNLTGRDGDRVSFDVRCPDGFASPAEPLVVAWLAVDGGSASHLVRCRKLRHRLVVVVRADGGPNLPLLRLGRVVGTTDASGAAGVMFDLDVDERVELTLSTASLASERISPRDPTVVFDVDDADDVKLFDVKLTGRRAPPPRGRPRRHGPVPM